MVYEGGWNMLGWWHHGFGVGGWETILIGLLTTLLFWGGLFAFLFIAMRAATGTWRAGKDREHNPSDAREILARRFATGEISADEYREMKRTLKA